MASHAAPAESLRTSREGTDLGNLGGLYAQLGDVRKATECLTQAQTIFEATRSPYAEQARRQLAKLGASVRPAEAMQPAI